ncbi:MAG TPA: DUF4349 domain-containing protein [Anaerolineales bacterium]|nr:DUF4349 domain-containing protein [Anaerolineales bacterium]
MNKKTISLFLIFLVSIWLLASCAGAAPAENFAMEEAVAPMAFVEPGEAAPVEAPAEAEMDAPSDGGEGITEVGNTVPIAARDDRLIIKNAEVQLLVEDSETAIDLTTQVVTDVGGYIISSRVWYQDWGGVSYKYSTITMGVPVEEFERTLRRLRELAIRVLDENASGEDVTDQYVDLQSQLDNLIATRDRIRTFLDQAQTVEEALAVNEQLSEVEGEIETIQGQINYLADRAAFSTITVTINPNLPELPTPTPYPTSTPEAWKPGETFGQATKTLQNAYQGLFDLLIWIVVVFIPIIAPFVFVGWLVWFVIKKAWTKNQSKDSKRPEPPAGA